ncbi:unnamed protein product [Closterium sp. NIES-64]|nr:unnamed protein product [Closterium sp. NIES-64]
MAARQLLLWLRMDLHDEDSRFFSTVSRFPPCPHPPHQSTAPRLSPLHLISPPTSPLGTSGPQLCERLRCRERSRGGGEWGLLMGLAEAIEDVFGVEDGGAVVRWIYRQPHRSERGVKEGLLLGRAEVIAPHLVFLHRLIDTRPNGHTAQLSQALSPPFPIPSRSASLFPPPPAMMHLFLLLHVSAQYLLLTYRFLAHKSPTSATWAHCSQGTRGLPSALLPGLHRTFLSPPLPSFLSSSTPLFTSFTPASPTPTSGLLKPRSYAPHLLLPRHLLPHGLPHTHGTGALLTQEEVAAMAELHGRLQVKLGEARLLGSPWRFLRMAGQREEEVCESRMPAVADRVVLRKLAQDMCEWSRLLVSDHNAHFFSAPISPPPSLTPLPQPSPPPLSLTPLPQPSPPHLSPISLPHPLAPTASTHPSPLPAFPHLSPTLRTPHPYPSLPRLSPNTSLNLFPKPLPQTSRPTRSPTPFPPRLPPVPPLHASFQHLPLSRLGHTPLPHRLPPPCPDPAGRSQLARRQWDPVASASQSSPHLHIPHLHLFHGPATRFLSFMPSCGCVVRRGGEWGEDKAVPGLFSRRKAKMTTIITSPSGHLAFSLAGSVLRLL